MLRPNSIDEIIEIYKRNVDVSLLDECLKRTVEERLRMLEASQREAAAQGNRADA